MFSRSPLVSLIRETIPEDQIKRVIDTNLAYINQRTTSGYTPLMVAAENTKYYGSENIVLLLLAAGADINAKDIDGEGVLCSAIHFSKLHSTEKTLQILLFYGADVDVNSLNHFGETVLVTAVLTEGTSGSENAVRILLEAGAETNVVGVTSEGETALKYAARMINEGCFCTTFSITMLIENTF